MKSPDSYITNLFEKYLQGTATTQEFNELLTYFGVDEHPDQLKSLILSQLEKDTPQFIAEEHIDQLAKHIDISVLEHINSQHKKQRFPWRWLSVAATVTIIGIAGTIYALRENPKESNATTLKEEIMPGTHRAILTIENGQPIQLTDAAHTLRNTGDSIYYGDNEAIPVAEKVQWATLVTPRAGQYQIMLEDGTKVWLNAESKIKYPTKFSGNERRIFVSGEVYLEVAHLPNNKPFIVETQQQNIRVLGTKFNVDAYPNSAIQATTLVEGKVEVSSSKGGEIQVLRPGQQACITSSGIASVKEVDPQDYTAWLDGIIVLNSVNLYQIAHQLERWYDVDFETIPETLGRKKVFGSLKRDLPLKDVLNALEINYNVTFTLKGRRVSIVSK